MLYRIPDSNRSREQSLVYFLHNYVFLREILLPRQQSTMKIKLLETFQLNCSGVLGLVWKQNNSYSTFAILCGHHKQHGTLSLFQSERFQVHGDSLPKFLWHPLHLSLWRRPQLERCSWWAPTNETKKMKFAWAKKKNCLDLEGSSCAWRCCKYILHVAAKSGHR